MAYPPIADHGLIGDLQNGRPRSDGRHHRFLLLPPFRFADRLRLAPRRQARRPFCPGLPSGPHVAKQMYLPNTAVPVTRFLSSEGVAEVVDFLPIENPKIATDRHRLVRMVRGIRGHVELEASVEPRPDYARGSAKARVTTGPRQCSRALPLTSTC